MRESVIMVRRFASYCSYRTVTVHTKSMGMTYLNISEHGKKALLKWRVLNLCGRDTFEENVPPIHPV